MIDYTKSDFTQSEARYDVIYDTVGATSFGRCKRVLSDSGIFVQAPFRPSTFPQMIRTSIVGKKRVMAGVAKVTKEDLIYLVDLVNERAITPVIDRTYVLEEAATAHSYVETGRKKGAVVLIVPR